MPTFSHEEIKQWVEKQFELQGLDDTITKNDAWTFSCFVDNKFKIDTNRDQFAKMSQEEATLLIEECPAKQGGEKPSHLVSLQRKEPAMPTFSHKEIVDWVSLQWIFFSFTTCLRFGINGDFSSDLTQKQMVDLIEQLLKEKEDVK